MIRRVPAVLFVLLVGSASPNSAGSPGSARSGERVVIGSDNAGRRLVLVSRQGFLMTRETARAFDLLERHARREGVAITITSGYRSYQDQVAVARRYGLYERGGLAARPGTSPHGQGTALDLDDGRGYSWLARVAPLYGFCRSVPGEPWHFQFIGVLAKGGD